MPVTAVTPATATIPTTVATIATAGIQHRWGRCSFWWSHRLNMESDLQSLFGLMYSAACTHWLRPRNSPLSPHLGSYMRAPLVSQDRRRLFFNPLSEVINRANTKLMLVYLYITCTVTVSSSPKCTYLCISSTLYATDLLCA